MGMDLVGKGGAKFQLSGDWWWFYINLAHEHGWEPRGTRRPASLDPSVEWEGGYDTGDGQTVEEDDARSLAAALTKALADPGAQAVIDTLIDEWFSDAAGVLASPRLSEKQKAVLRARVKRPEYDAKVTRELIAFCHAGEFRLE